MKTRIFGTHKIKIATRTLRLADISRNTRFQYRHDDNPFIRGKDIAKSMKDTEATKFRDNPVIAEINGVYFIVDGFGRIAAATLLGWEEIEVDVLSGRDVETRADWIALNANNGQVTQRGYTKAELAENAYRLNTIHGWTYDEIAESQGVLPTTIARRVMKGKLIAERRADSENVAVLPIFPNGQAAQTSAFRALNTVLRLKCNNYTDLCDTLAARFGVELRILAGNNEKQVKGLLYDLCNNHKNGRPTNFLVLFYLATEGQNTGAGHRTLEGVKHFTREYLEDNGSFHGEDLANHDAALNSRAVAQYVQACRDARRTASAA